MSVIKREDLINLEKYNIEVLGINPHIFIENAANKLISNIDLNMRKSFAVICGVSKNGAIGLAIARNLIALDKYVEIFIVESKSQASEEFSDQYRILEKMDVRFNYLETIEELENFSRNLEKVNTIIDAIASLEFTNQFEGPVEYAIDTINKSRIHIISVDLPSGMDYDTGKTNIACIDADVVVTFEGLKEGLLLNRSLHRMKVIEEKIGFVKRGRDVRHKTY